MDACDCKNILSEIEKLTLTTHQVPEKCRFHAGVEAQLLALEKALGIERDYESERFRQGPVVFLRWREAENWPVEYVSSNIGQFGIESEQLTLFDGGFRDILFQEDLPQIESVLALFAEKKQQSAEVRVRMMTGSGQPVWILLHMHAFYDACDHMTHLESYFMDISQTMQEHLQLVRSEFMLKTLANAACALLSGDDYDGAITSALEMIGTSLGADTAVLYEVALDKDSGEAYTSCRFRWFSEDRFSVCQGRVTPLNGHSHSLWMEKLLSRQALHLEDFTDVAIEGFERAKSLIALPVFQGRSFWGFLALTEFDQPVWRGKPEEDALMTLAASIGGAMARKQVEDQLRRLSSLDGLTGVPNRRYLQEQAEACFVRAGETHSAVTVMMMDIDFFKKYNDLYGHLAGDDVLRSVATAIDRYTSANHGFMARFGGEEFCAVFIGAPGTRSRQIAEEILQVVRQLNLRHEDSEVAGCVTLSMGVARVVPSSDISFKDAVAMADTALYRAKLAGRNRAESHFMD